MHSSLYALYYGSLIKELSYKMFMGLLYTIIAAFSILWCDLLRPGAPKTVFSGPNRARVSQL